MALNYFTTQAQQEELVKQAVAYAAAHGIEMISKHERGPGLNTHFVLAPITCVPTETPRAAFKVGGVSSSSSQSYFNTE